MKPFRRLLPKNAEYVWTPDLQKAFDNAKAEIVLHP